MIADGTHEQSAQVTSHVDDTAPKQARHASARAQRRTFAASRRSAWCRKGRAEAPSGEVPSCTAVARHSIEHRKGASPSVPEGVASVWRPTSVPRGRPTLDDDVESTEARRFAAGDRRRSLRRSAQLREAARNVVGRTHGREGRERQHAQIGRGRHGRVARVARAHGRTTKEARPLGAGNGTPLQPCAVSSARVSADARACHCRQWRSPEVRLAMRHSVPHRTEWRTADSPRRSVSPTCRGGPGATKSQHQLERAARAHWKHL